MATRKSTKLIAVHVTATSPKTKLTMAALRKMHKARGWSGTGYNEVIFRDGRSEISERGLNGIGAHVAGFNSIAYGIALEGGVDENGKGDVSTITEKQWATLERRLRELQVMFPSAKICGHRDLSPDKDGDGIIEPYEYLKECPTFDAIPWAISKGLKGADIRGTWKVGAPLPGAPVETFVGPDTRNAYLQRLLRKAGYNFGPIDGIVGKNTKAAIGEYQRANKLKATREFDAATVAHLRSRFEATDKAQALLAADLATSLDRDEAIQAYEPAKAQSFLGGSILTGIGGAIAKNAIEGALEGVLKKAAKAPDVPIHEPAVKPIVEAAVPEVADALRTEVEAMKRYAEDKEPWWKSFLVTGGLGGVIIVVGAAATALQDGFQYSTDAEVCIAAIGAAGGYAWQLYGRYFNRKPIGE